MAVDREQETAWRLWHLLEELNSLLWDRYEAEFIERHLCEQDRRQAIVGDGNEPDQHPF